MATAKSTAVADAPDSLLKGRVSTGISQTAPTRSVKRRASKACACCRTRKVRCNVVENGIPCTNCRLDGVDCVLVESRRKRRPQKGSERKDTTADSISLGTGRRDSMSSQADDHELPVLENMNVDVDGHDVSTSSVEMLNTGTNSSLHVPHMIYQTQGHRMSQQERVRRLSLSQQSMGPSPIPMAIPTPKQLHQVSPHINRLDTYTSIKLPRFIRPLPRRLDYHDVEYLAKKGALQIPSKTLRTELLRCFVEYVYPYMPSINLRDFLVTVLSKDEATEGNVSLLLYQAVMFAGAAFVDMNHLRAAGFATRRKARKALFQRPRLLYDFDYETDRIVIVQALLLMTYWYDSPDDQKDTWHWMGVSLSLAHTMGLHHNPARSGSSHESRKLSKRIWWSLLMRDRLIALGMRRPTRVQNEDCDVPMLSLGDFDTAPFPEEVVNELGGCTVLRSRGQLTQLAVLCIEQAKLCRSISDVLSTQYSISGSKQGNSHISSITLVPRRGDNEFEDLQSCDSELERWHKSLASEARYDPWASPDEDGRVLFLHRALLKMVYLTTVSALHRPHVLSANPTPTFNYDVANLSRVKVRDAAVGITDIAQQLQSRDLIRFLPTVGVTVLLPAVLIHLLDIRSSDESIRTASLCRFYQCMQVLMRLREIYASADAATVFLGAAIHKANLHFPSLSGGSGMQKQPTIPRAEAQPQPIVSTLTPPPDLDSTPAAVPFSESIDFINETTPASSHSSFTVDSDSLPPFVDLDSSPLIQTKDFATADHTTSTTHTFLNFDEAMDIDFFDGIVMPANSEGPISPPSTAMAMKDFEYNTSGSTAQGESSGFALDLDMMTDIKGLDGLEWT